MNNTLQEAEKILAEYKQTQDEIVCSLQKRREAKKKLLLSCLASFVCFAGSIWAGLACHSVLGNFLLAGCGGVSAIYASTNGMRMKNHSFDVACSEHVVAELERRMQAPTNKPFFSTKLGR